MLAVMVFWVCIFSCIFVFTVCLRNAQFLLDYLLAVLARSALFLVESVLNCREWLKKGVLVILCVV
jgi:hypothetical protein